MDYTNLNGLFAGVNSSLNPVFTWGYPAPAVSSFTAKFTAKAGFPVIDAERALTLLCAELTGLQWEKEIFRAEVPERIGSGYFVALEQEIPCTDPDCRVFKACFSGTKLLRDSILERAALLTGKLPLPGTLKVNSDKQSHAVIFTEIIPAKLEYHTGAEAGRFRFYTGVSLKVSCRTN